MDLTAVLLALLLLVIGLLTGWLISRRRTAAGPLHDPALAEAIRPLGVTLDRVQREIQAIERERSSSYGELREQVRAMSVDSAALRHETASLVTALRAPIVRGRWGELQLRRIVEAAGMLRHCDFVEQPTSTTADGTLRPDLVVTLTGGRKIVVDAKVPFAGYVEAMDAPDEQTRTTRLRAHARHLRGHIDGLAGKGYAARFTPTPEFVVLFVPSDAFLQAALEHDPALLEYGFDRDVVVATPSTLIALLRTVAFTWRQEAVAENAQQVLALGRELHSRLATMGGHVVRLGSALTSAVARYNETVGSLERSVLVSARRFTDLEVTTAELAAPGPLDAVTRPLQAPELLASADDALVDLAEARAGAAEASRRAVHG